jgi:hypothetical protein
MREMRKVSSAWRSGGWAIRVLFVARKVDSSHHNSFVATGVTLFPCDETGVRGRGQGPGMGETSPFGVADQSTSMPACFRCCRNVVTVAPWMNSPPPARRLPTTFPAALTIGPPLKPRGSNSPCFFMT